MTGPALVDPAAAAAPPPAGDGMLGAAMAALAGPPAPPPNPLAPKPAAIVRAKKMGDPPEARAALVKRWLGKIDHAERHWAPVFKRMRADMDFAAGKQYDGEVSDADDRYKVNIVLRHIANRVSTLYARAPTWIAKRRSRQDFLVWDEEPASLQAALHEATAAMQAMQAQAQPAMPGAPPVAPQPVQPPSPETIALLQDVADGYGRRKLMQRIGRSLEILFHYFTNEQLPPFKEGAKQMVRRVLTCGVGYVKLDFQRMMQRKPDTESRIADYTDRLAHIERLKADLAEGEVLPDSADAEELRVTLEQLKAEPEIIVREGLEFSFPKATAIIPDPACTNLKTWAGSDWLAEQFILTVGKIKEIYNVDISGSFEAYSSTGSFVGGWRPKSADAVADKMESFACVYEVEQKSTGLKYAMARGYKDFLREPAAPNVALERFFTVYAITFNDVEHDKEIFPPSDARLLRSPQQELNRTKEAKRQHRIASRPLYAAAAGSLEEEDQDSMANHAAHEILMLKGLTAGQKVADLLQAVPKAPIDPNFYESESIFGDAQQAVGAQEANFGSAPNKGSATGQSIAENSRLSSLSSNTDDLDELLTMLARDGAQVLLTEMSVDQVKKIAGPGAVWPEMSRTDVQEEIGLEVQAGSSGRPNKEKDAAVFERLAPFLMQVPGINPSWLAQYMLGLLDDPASKDLTEALADGMASIVALNRPPPAAPPAGPQGPVPAAQGPAGAGNAAPPQAGPGGPQPAFPGSASGPGGGAPAPGA